MRRNRSDDGAKSDREAAGRFRVEVRNALKAAAEPERAPAMQAYMKSAMRFYGVPSPALKKALKPIFDAHRVDTFEAWTATALDLWRNAKAREERYAALRFCEHRYYKAFHTFDALPMYEEMIVTGAWWDYVDWIAGGRLGPILDKDPVRMKKTMRAWAKGDAMWKARSAILCQLKAKDRIDLKLLYDCIEPSLSSKEFFLRKAIGWALRQHAKTDAEEVYRYVVRKKDVLSGLSKREALKNTDYAIP